MMDPNRTMIQAPGSPVSPNTVTTMFDWEQAVKKDDRKKNISKMDMPPVVVMTEQPTLLFCAAAALVKDNNDTPPNKFQGSTPFHGLYSFRPTDKVLNPFLRTALTTDPRVAVRIAESILDDVLQNQLKFQKDGNVFSGLVQGRRLVLARIGDNDNKYALACADRDQAQQLLFFLQALDVQVEELSM